MLLEYEGTRYCGFQIQKGVPTIQGELEKAITRATGEAARVHGAGRTDAGVHARGQVAAFDTESRLAPDRLIRALNFYLPADVVVRSARSVRAGFDPRRDALSREYRYTILNREVPSPLLGRWSYFVPGQLNIELMIQAARILVGTHDFASFTSSEGAARTTVRTILEAGVKRKGSLVVFDVSANAFLHQQVRRTVGCLIAVGRGETGIDEMRELVVSARVGIANRTVPPQGLCLMKVNYPDMGFGE